MLLNVDNMVVGSVSGAVTLGFYVLAFNISSWPTSVVGTAIRAVAMPAFARDQDRGGRVDDLVGSTAVTIAVVVPIGAGLAVLAAPTIEFVYGERWLPAVPALVGLGCFGLARVVFDLWIAFLTARGASGWLLGVQALWVAVLAPVMWVANHRWGLAGAGWAHVVVALLVVLPAFLVAMRHLGVPADRLLATFLAPCAAAVPAVAAAWAVTRLVEQPFVALIAGGLTLALVYGCLEWTSFRRQSFVHDYLAGRARVRRVPITTAPSGGGS